MALSIGAPGRSPEEYSGKMRYRSVSEFRDIIVKIVEQKLVDIMLMAASTSEVVTIHRRIFAEDTPANTPYHRAVPTHKGCNSRLVTAANVVL